MPLLVKAFLPPLLQVGAGSPTTEQAAAGIAAQPQPTPAVVSQPRPSPFESLKTALAAVQQSVQSIADVSEMPSQVRGSCKQLLHGAACLPG